MSNSTETATSLHSYLTHVTESLEPAPPDLGDRDHLDQLDTPSSKPLVERVARRSESRELAEIRTVLDTHRMILAEINASQSNITAIQGKLMKSQTRIAEAIIRLSEKVTLITGVA